MRETSVLYIRLPAELYARIRAKADTDRRSVNMTARILLEDGLTWRGAIEHVSSVPDSEDEDDTGL